MRAGVVVLALLGGCELFAAIPEPVDDSTDGGADDAIAACVSNEGCVAPRPVCVLETGTCAECATGAECSAAMPACLDHACAACTEDDQCATGVCLPDGTCAAEARILHAAPAGAGVACSAPAPCSFETAVSKLDVATDVIALAPGTYPRSATVSITKRAVIAGTGAVFDGTNGAGGEAMLSPAGADVTLIGLRLVGPAMGGVACTASGTVRLDRVTIEGVSFGMYANPCATEIRRSRFIGNGFYAFYLRNSSVAIENIEVARNGNTQFQIAAMVLETVTGIIENATIAYNIGVGPPTAISCTTSPALAIRSSIFFQNTIDAACNVTYSIVDAGYTGGANNAVADPMFVAATTNDLHLAPGSPAAGIGDPASLVKRDRDGQPRPQPAGTRVDVGADEIP